MEKKEKGREGKTGSGRNIESETERREGVRRREDGEKERRKKCPTQQHLTWD